MYVVFNSYERLNELEADFKNRTKKHEIHFLGDILLTEEQVEELAGLIRNLFLAKSHNLIKTEYSLTTSLFLVWCSIYNYKEGTFWEPIFSRLKIRYNPKVSEFLGETFLWALRKYGLQQISTAEKTKKYMTPVLMHGYIGDYYAGKFLDYLNAAYTSYLKYDVSDKALENIWPDLFNLQSEQLSIKGKIEELEENEHHLRAEIQRYTVPVNLRNMSRPMLLEQESKAHKLKERSQVLSQRIKDLKKEIQRYENVERESKDFQLSLKCLRQIGLFSWQEELQQLIELQEELSCLVTQKVIGFNEQIRNNEKEKVICESQYAIELEKIKAIKTSILTLGKGREDEGWSILNDYQELQKALERVQSHLTKKRTLYQIEEQLRYTSIQQILTSSLTHLAVENPVYFQSFIKSTLRLMDGVFRNQQVDETHRMYQPICRWRKTLDEKKNVPPEKDSSSHGLLRNQHIRSYKQNSNLRLTRPKLRQPSIVYEPGRRDLCLTIPEQELSVPKDFQEKPYFDLVYSERQEKIAVRSFTQRNKMLTQELTVKITSPEVKHLAFRWLNIFEYWPINLEPVMVFNTKKQLMSNHHIPNGFYYILARDDWRTDSLNIIEHYIGGPEGYRVYEVHMEEAELAFFCSDSAANPKMITIHCSRFSGFELKGVELLPGVFMEGTPVCYSASPVLTIGSREIDPQQLMFSLFYQGELFLQRPIQDLLDHYGKEISPYASEIDIHKMSFQRFPPHVEKVQISITDNTGQEVFGKSYCQVRGLSFRFRTSEIIVKIPYGSRLRYDNAQQEGTTYHIPVSDQPWTEVEIYIDRFGWKRFQLETPIVQFQLVDKDGRSLEYPLNLLCSEAKKLKEITINWFSDSSLPEKVILYDEDETLVSTFNFKNGCAQAQLQSFFDLIQGLTGSTKINFYWESKTRISPNFVIAEIFDQITVLESSLFQSERDNDNLFEISYTLNFPYQGQLMLRVYESDHPDNVLLAQKITSNPIYLYLNKDATGAERLTFEIYYLEHVESIFGIEENEIFCWKCEENRKFKKSLIKDVFQRGLVLEAFNYEQQRYELKDKFYIDQIMLEPRHFEEEELFKGIFRGKESSTVVYFYLDMENRKLPFLIDEDSDGVQYHSVAGELFWEYRDDREVMAPLDDLEYRIKEEDS